MKNVYFFTHCRYIIHGLTFSLVQKRGTDRRISYNEMDQALTENKLVSREPIGQFSAWYDEIKGCKNILANAACLATANKNGKPSARIVMVKAHGPDGFKFFTDYGSRKGQDLEDKPVAALTFYWPSFNRQVRIEGTVKKVCEEESQQYFERMSVESKICAIISRQSCVVSDRGFLVDSYKQLAKSDLIKPASWGGYLLSHKLVEFWQAQDEKIHDRIVYSRDNGDWKIHRLAP